MTMRREPMLDDQERELAAQLARIAPHGEPSANLDARILAMAERGLAGVSPTAAARRRPQRWPVWLGAAASLTVIAGLVWRLQPVLQPRETIRYEAPASVAADTDPNGRRQPIDYVESEVADAAAMPPPPPSEPVPARRPPSSQVQTEAAIEIAAAPIASPPSASPPAATNAAPQADATVAKSMAADRTMAQEAPRLTAPMVVETAEKSSVTMQAAPAPPPAAPAPAPSRAMREHAVQAGAAASSIDATLPPPEADRAGFDARPPITADTPEVQRAWLKRIRELRDAGDMESARSSLAAFAKRNPKAEIPADLKPLLPAIKPPSTPP